jgi:hypothetical protein
MKLDVLVIGSGGNGQTYFMEFLERNGLKINKLDDSDKLKHPCSPSKLDDLNITDKIIFIYNSPYESIQSHYRREWSFIQLKKLGNPYCFRENQIDTIEKYNELVIKNKLDLFGIEYQFVNWFKLRSLFDILFLDFNEVLERKQVLNNFLKRELNYHIFKVDERLCKKSNNVNIQKVYDNLYNFIKENSKKHLDEIIAKN